MNDFDVLDKLFNEMSTYHKSFEATKSRKDGFFDINVTGHYEKFRDAIQFKDNKIISLKLSSHSISDIPSCICELKNLEMLTLSGNGISSIPSCIYELKNLEMLTLSGNGISSIPDEISNLVKLRKLNLSGNKLKSLPRK